MRGACLAARGRPDRRRRVRSGGSARERRGSGRDTGLTDRSMRMGGDARYNGNDAEVGGYGDGLFSRSSGDRAIPYTVPMKVVQPQCCTSGAIASSTFGCLPKDGYGSLSPLVPVRALSPAGHVVFPLRSRPAVLQPILLVRRPPRAPTAQRPALPGQPRRTPQACGPHGLLASTSTLPCRCWHRCQ